MKVKTITKSMNVKFATLPYSNADIQVSMTAEVEKDEDPKSASELLTELIKQDIKDFKAAMDDLAVEVFDKPSKL